MKTLTWSALKELSPCPEAVVWGKEKYKEKETQDSLQIIKDLMEDQKFDWADWLIVRLMTQVQRFAYAIHTAEQVIDIFEKRYPDDNRPRKAIETAKAVLENDTEENRRAAYNAAFAAKILIMTIHKEAFVGKKIDNAVYAAYMAAIVACTTTTGAAYGTYHARIHAAISAAQDAAMAVASLVPNSVYKIEEKKMHIKILNYGMELMKKEK